MNTANLTSKSIEELDDLIGKAFEAKDLLYKVEDAKKYLSTLSDEVKSHLGLNVVNPVPVKEIVEVPFHEISIKTSYVSYRVAFMIENGRMVAKFTSDDNGSIGSIYAKDDWDGFYRLVCFVSDLMNTNDWNFNKTNILQVLRPDLCKSSCKVYAFHLAFVGNTGDQHRNLVDYVKSVGCRYEEILSKYA